MRIVVLGAGVIGVTTAYYLADRGHEVEVIDARERVAAEASGANAGLLVPGDSIVWNTPEAPLLLIRAATGRTAGFFRVRPSQVPALLTWGARFLRECAPTRTSANTAYAHRLSLYSYRQLRKLLDNERLDVDHRHDGAVFLFRDSKALEHGRRIRAGLADLGERYDVLTPAQLSALDPGYQAVSQDLAGALYAPSCGHADCAAFSQTLADRCAERNVTFSMGRRVTRLHVEDGRLAAVHTSEGVTLGDAVVLACGAWSPRLARSAGIRLPIVPVTGLALKVPIVHESKVPHIAGVDENARVAFSRTGAWLRLTSMAEFGGYDGAVRDCDYLNIRNAAEALFPEALDWSGALRGHGLRPVTPTGRPLIGPTRIRGLYVNTGHGHLGWTQACGSARIVADLIDGRPTEIEHDAYLPGR